MRTLGKRGGFCQQHSRSRLEVFNAPAAAPFYMPLEPCSAQVDKLLLLKAFVEDEAVQVSLNVGNVAQCLRMGLADLAVRRQEFLNNVGHPGLHHVCMLGLEGPQSLHQVAAALTEALQGAYVEEEAALNEF